MSHKMACEHADLIAGIITFSGVLWNDTTKCNPSEPVNILHVHGTNDSVIFYNGSSILGVPYPSALKTVDDWMTFNGCIPGSLQPSGSPIDLVSNLPGKETQPYSASGCKADVSHWKVENGIHTPTLNQDIGYMLIEYINSHPKPS